MTFKEHDVVKVIAPSDVREGLVGTVVSLHNFNTEKTDQILWIEFDNGDVEDYHTAQVEKVEIT